jgi:homoserine kinase
MSNSSVIRVQVPATTANLGPGFDCLGAALSRYNSFEFRALDSVVPPTKGATLQIEVSGPESEQVQRTAQNLVYQAFCYYYNQCNQPVPDLHLTIQLGIPLSRGLGSSATAIVGGLVGANAMAGSPLSPLELLDFAVTLEGHPDNVAPALLGGCQLSVHDEATQKWTLCAIDWSPEIVPVVAIPNFELSTEQARQVLPKQCSYTDAIFNLSHLGLLVKGLESAREEWIRTALQDRLHQPYRAALISGLPEVQKAALAAGAAGLVISGAGPTLLALTVADHASAVAQQMQTAWQHFGVVAEVSIAQIDHQGTIVMMQST